MQTNYLKIAIEVLNFRRTTEGLPKLKCKFSYVLLSNANLMLSENFFNNGRGGNLNYKKIFFRHTGRRFCVSLGREPKHAKPRAADHKAYKERLHHYERLLASV